MGFNNDQITLSQGMDVEMQKTLDILQAQIVTKLWFLLTGFIVKQEINKSDYGYLRGNKH